MSADDSIVLKEYSADWPTLASSEIESIRALVPEARGWRIEHIGSTAIPGIYAKPLIDIAVEVPSIDRGQVAVLPLESIGYSYWRDNPDKRHLFFVKGLPPEGKGRTHHVHFFEPDRFEERTRFRDALIANAKLAKAYEALKLELASEFEFDREAYTEAKLIFIRSVLCK